MDALLAPWLTRADALYEDWRSVLHGGSMDNLKPSTRCAFVLQASPPTRRSRFLESIYNSAPRQDPEQQWQLRELLEVLALALRVDARRCLELACDGQAWISPLNGTPFARGELLPITIQAALTPKTPATTVFCQSFLVDWNDATASDAFMVTKDALVDMRVPARVKQQRFKLALELKLHSDHSEHSTLALGPMIQFLHRIDRAVFRVTQITLTIKHSDYVFNELTEFFQCLHTFRDEANVRIRLQMCQDMQGTIDLGAWKVLFDLIARKTFPFNGSDDRRKKRWDIDVTCGGPGIGNDPECGQDRWSVLTDARVIAACFSALAHAGSHVTDVKLDNPLEDRTSEHREPRDRDVRAKWLGYLLRAGVVPDLTLDEGKLTWSDLRSIESMIKAPTRADCFRLLWKEDWRRVQPGPDSYYWCMGRDEDEPDPTYKHSVIGEDVMTDPSEVLGQMEPNKFHQSPSPESSVEDSFADVFLVSYGQCSIPRSQLTRLQTVRQTTETPTQLKSLTIRLRESGQSVFSRMFAPETNDRPDAPLLHLLPLLGKHLEELTIDASNMQLSLAVLPYILRVCPHLRRLHINALQPDVKEDSQRLPKSTGVRHPLKVLELTLHLNAQSSGLRALSKWMIWFGLELRDFRLRTTAQEPLVVTDPIRLAMEKMLRTCCQSCSTLQLSGLPVDYIRVLFNKKTNRNTMVEFPRLGTLLLEDTIWSTAAWSGLLLALSSPDHPLTQSLHTLGIRNYNFSSQHSIDLAQMLATNRRLVHVRFVTRGRVDARLGDTDGIALQRQKTPFGMRHKAAFLSALERTTALPWESFVLSKILRFVVEPEIRRIRL